VYLWTAGRLFSRQYWDWGLVSAKLQYPAGSTAARPTDDWTYSNMTFTRWYTSQPDNAGGREGCVNIWPEKSYRWNDQRCETALCFVCENRNA